MHLQLVLLVDFLCAQRLDLAQALLFTLQNLLQLVDLVLEAAQLRVLHDGGTDSAAAEEIQTANTILCVHASERSVGTLRSIHGRCVGAFRIQVLVLATLAVVHVTAALLLVELVLSLILAIRIL